MNQVQTQQQQRAAHALEWVKAKQNTANEKEIPPKASQFPVMIHTTGLGQACAFYKSREANSAEVALYEQLSQWLRCGNAKAIFHGQRDLLEALTQTDMATYQLAQAEALSYLNWIKQLSKAYLKVDSNQKESKPQEPQEEQA